MALPQPVRALSLGRDSLVGRPRWYAHAYNQPQLYQLAAGLGWLPRRTRLALARAIGRLAPRLMSAERAAIARTLQRITGATGHHLEALIASTFTDFAMCFSDLVSTNRRPAPELAAHVTRVDGMQWVTGLNGGFISLTAHVGNWELAGRLLAGRAARATHVVVAEEEARDL